MKFYAIAIASVAMLGAAIAQTAPSAPAAPVAPATPTAEYESCPVVPADPGAWPDGATAKAKDMETAQKRYSDWEASLAPSIACRRAAQQKVKASAEATTAAFNADATRVNAVRNSWKSEADEFTARQPVQKQKDNRTGRQ